MRVRRCWTIWQSTNSHLILHNVGTQFIAEFSIKLSDLRNITLNERTICWFIYTNDDEVRSERALEGPRDVSSLLMGVNAGLQFTIVNWLLWVLLLIRCHSTARRGRCYRAYAPLLHTDKFTYSYDRPTVVHYSPDCFVFIPVSLLEAHLKCYEWEKHTYLPMATGTLFAFCLWFSHYDLRTYCGLIISNRRKSRFALRGGELMS